MTGPGPHAFLRYAEPERRAGHPLAIAPRLASWDAADNPSQIALGQYLDHVEDLVGPDLATIDGDVTCSLTVGLPSTASLTSGGRDLNNFAFPVATRIGPARVAAFFTSKVAGDASSVATGPAQPAGDLAGGWGFFSTSATASATTKAWKDQVAAQVPSVETGDTPLELEIGFIVGPGRNWAGLWKPAIDSLGGILGVDNPSRPYFPRDDRVVPWAFTGRSTAQLAGRSTSASGGVWLTTVNACHRRPPVVETDG